MQHDSKAHLNLETRQALEARLSEAEETLRAIRAGEIDALIVQGTLSERVYTLRNADYPYRTLVEQMQNGAAILSPDEDVLYCNQSFAGLVGTPLQEVIGGPVARYFIGASGKVLETLLAAGCGKRRTRLSARDGREVDVLVSLTSTATSEVERRSLIVTDLTQLSDAQIGLECAQQQSHAKDEFMAMLAHELRNPTELPDIAVIDVGLPGLDGYQIASSFRKEPMRNRVLLVALTGYGTPDARERSRAAGFDHHLIKPIDPEMLRELMMGAPERPHSA